MSLLLLLRSIRESKDQEKPHGSDRLWWPMFFAILPLIMLLFLGVLSLWEKYPRWIMEREVRVFLLILAHAGVLLAVTFPLAGIFRRVPLLLIPVYAVSWSAGIWLGVKFL